MMYHRASGAHDLFAWREKRFVRRVACMKAPIMAIRPLIFHPGGDEIKLVVRGVGLFLRFAFIGNRTD